MMLTLFTVFIDVITGYREQQSVSTRRFAPHGDGPFISNTKVRQDVLGILAIFSGSHWTVDGVVT